MAKSPEFLMQVPHAAINKISSWTDRARL